MNRMTRRAFFRSFATVAVAAAVPLVAWQSVEAGGFPPIYIWWQRQVNGPWHHNGPWTYRQYQGEINYIRQIPGNINVHGNISATNP
jgi:hypothetical protein